MASESASLTVVALRDGLDVVLALIVDDLQQRLFVERAAARCSTGAGDLEGVVGEIAHEPDRGVVGVGEGLGEFGQHAVLHLRGDELQHVVEQRALALRCGRRRFEEEIGDFPQQFAALRAVGACAPDRSALRNAIGTCGANSRIHDKLERARKQSLSELAKVEPKIASAGRPAARIVSTERGIWMLQPYRARSPAWPSGRLRARRCSARALRDERTAACRGRERVRRRTCARRRARESARATEAEIARVRRERDDAL